MISIVVVYNDERTLNETLLESLKNQTAKFELITLDNTKGKFNSAAEALNYGGKRVSGKYIMFVHQDVELDSNLWLERIGTILDEIPDLGIAGVAGMSEKGRNNIERGRGWISSSGEVWRWSNPVQKPEKVQTLDECLLIVPSSVFSKIQFDEKTFDGWHCYGADYCLCAKQIGLSAYVIPAFVHHRSLGLNAERLFEYQKRLYIKHQKNYKYIYTTSGELSLLRLKLKSCIEKIDPFCKKLFFLSWNYLTRQNEKLVFKK